MSCGCNDTICRDLFLLTGDKGDSGSNGLNGTYSSNSDKFQFNVATVGNPGAGKLLFNNANLAAATSISVSTTDFTSSNVATWLAAAGTSDATVKGFIMVNKEFDSTSFAIFSISAVTSNVTYYTLSLTYLASSSNSPFASNDNVIFSYSISGSNGAAGQPGRTVLFNDLTNVTAAATGGVSTTYRTKTVAANTLIADGDSIVFRGSWLNNDANSGTISNEFGFFVFDQGGTATIISSFLPNVPYGESFVEQITLTRKNSNTLTVEAMLTSGTYNRASASVASDFGAGLLDWTLPFDIKWNVQNTGVQSGFPQLRRMYAEYNPI